MKPHTCSEWNPDTDVICAKPANFLLEIESDGLRTSNWKCPIHIRRYSRQKPQPGVRMTITATKGPANDKPRTNRPHKRLRRRIESRG